MTDNYIELRTRSTFGDIINTYFTFLKYNFKTYTNLYLKYNALCIAFALICGYLLVTGFMGLASRDFRFGFGDAINSDVYLISGGIILVLVLFFTLLINYSFSSAFVGDYVKNSGIVDAKRIWQSILKNLGTIILFILIGIVMYLTFIVLSFILAFIPFIGMLTQYAMQFMVTAIFGLTFMSIFSTQKSIGEAISEGFNFAFSNFWRVILYGLVIGILNLIIMGLILSIPSVIMGIYVYFSVESGADLSTSTFATIVFTLGFAFFILTYIFSQALSQIAYSILYYNLFEEKYNVYLQSQINQIGINK